jgi:hypothetical protein
MIHFEGRDAAGPTLKDAEALVRSLVGVAAVRIVTAPDGSLREIVVVPESDGSTRQVSRNVASALMAQYGVDLNPDTISITALPADTDHRTGATDEPARKAESPQGSGPDVPERQEASSSSNGRAGAYTRNGTSHGNGTVSGGTGGTRAEPPADDAPEPQAAERTVAGAGGRSASPNRPRLELTELTRVDNNLRCRVVVAAGTERFVGVGDGEHARITDVELAGRVAVDALRAARTPRDPIQFDGAVLVDIAGQAHVATSLSVWTGSDFKTISGAAPVRDSPAESAARAVVDSIVAHLTI